MSEKMVSNTNWMCPKTEEHTQCGRSGEIITSADGAHYSTTVKLFGQTHGSPNEATAEAWLATMQQYAETALGTSAQMVSHSIEPDGDRFSVTSHFVNIPTEKAEYFHDFMSYLASDYEEIGYRDLS